MKKLKVSLLSIIVIVMSSCISTLPLNSEFYNTKKVGVIITVDSITVAKEGGQGLLDMALTPGNRFYGPLKAVESQFNSSDNLQIELRKIFNYKNKSFDILNVTNEVKNLEKFEPTEKSKKYSKLDYRIFKDKYDIDEVLHINIKYGLLVSYYGMIELGKDGFCEINSKVINLTDNSLLQQETVKSITKINGNWKKGEDYNNLKVAIQSSINGSIMQLTQKFN